MTSKASLEVLVLFEDDAGRDAAAKFCDSLVTQFWANNLLDITWSSFEDLKREKYASETAAKATSADLLVFSFQPREELSRDVRAWMARWANGRGDREGAIVGLGDPAGFGGAPAASFTWLRRFAHEAGLDYLTKAPPELTGFGYPDTPEPYTERAHRSSSVLDEILRHRSPPAVH